MPTPSIHTRQHRHKAARSTSPQPESLGADESAAFELRLITKYYWQLPRNYLADAIKLKQYLCHTTAGNLRNTTPGNCSAALEVRVSHRATPLNMRERANLRARWVKDYCDQHTVRDTWRQYCLQCLTTPFLKRPIDCSLVTIIPFTAPPLHHA